MEDRRIRAAARGAGRWHAPWPARVARGAGRRRATRLALVLALAAALLPAWGATAATAESSKDRPAQSAASNRTTCSTAAYHGDKRLGPKRLPTRGVVAKLLRGWERLAGMSSRRYLQTYYDDAAKSWRYPPQGGYALTPLGVPIISQVTLIQGQLVDRFGSEGGSYLAPDGTPYAARGIPPESLNPFPGGQPCNYSRYRVVKPFPVDAGPIAPALGQSGFGMQYVLDTTLFPGVTERVNVAYLLANGYLERFGAVAQPAAA